MAKPPEKPIRSFTALNTNDLIEGIRDVMGQEGDPCGGEIVNFTPHVDIFTNLDALVVELEAPGVDLNEIDISFIKNNLLIKGKKRETMSEEGEGSYVCMERCYGRFYRSIELPFPVDSNGITASYKNGILTITAPKIADKRGAPKHIPIQAG